MIPRYFFLTNGVGKATEELASFELALRDAGVEKQNLVAISSIKPPGCKLIPKEKGIKMLNAGEITFVVIARNQTNEPHRLLGASVGLAIPSKKEEYGYLSEIHSYGQNDQIIGDRAEDLAASMLATTLGIEFNQESSWSEKEQVFRAGGRIIRTSNVTQTALGDRNGLWTTVVALAVMIE